MRNGKSGMPPHKINDPVMGAAKSLLGQQAVWFRGEISVAEEQKLQCLAQLLSRRKSGLT